MRSLTMSSFRKKGFDHPNKIGYSNHYFSCMYPQERNKNKQRYVHLVSYFFLSTKCNNTVHLRTFWSDNPLHPGNRVYHACSPSFFEIFSIFFPILPQRPPQAFLEPRKYRTELGRVKSKVWQKWLLPVVVVKLKGKATIAIASNSLSKCSSRWW